MWIVPSEFSKALEGLSRLGGADGESRSWLDVDGSDTGSSKPTAEMDTAGWFESQLPAAADQREAKIELTSILDESTPAVPKVPAPPSLTQAKDEAVGNGAVPPAVQ